MADHDIIVDFSGWISIDSKKLMFLHMETMETISGDKWIQLSEDDRADYIVEDVIAAIRDAEDGEWNLIDIADIVEIEKN
jgi:hypothetical protein